MEALVLTSGSKSDLSLIYELAKKIGVKAQQISNEELEDSALLIAMKSAKTDEYVDNEAFLEYLRK
jgi:hypothetical protein